MKEHQPDPLLREVLESDELSKLRRASMAEGVACLKRRRQRRGQVAQVLAFASVTIALGLTVFNQASRRAPAPESSVTMPQRETHQVKVISDAELFALFPGRPIALVGEPGEQRLVFLDEAKSVGEE